jgi:hypothetical protein
VSGVRGNEVTHSNYKDMEDLEVYKNSYVEKIRENIGTENPRAERRRQLPEETAAYSVCFLTPDT